MTKRKSKLVVKKGHKRSKSGHHHHHHDDEENHHHHHEEEDHHHHDSDHDMPCVDTIMAFEVVKVGQFNLEVSKEDIHRMILRGMQYV